MQMYAELHLIDVKQVEFARPASNGVEQHTFSTVSLTSVNSDGIDVVNVVLITVFITLYLTTPLVIQVIQIGDVRVCGTCNKVAHLFDVLAPWA
jgi:hypothetical protein